MRYRGRALHRERALEAFDRRAEELGVLRYRRQRMLLNRGTVIIVVGDRGARVMMYDVMSSSTPASTRSVTVAIVAREARDGALGEDGEEPPREEASSSGVPVFPGPSW